ncbi:MAG: hypothetical protein COC08_07085, partial [Maribacter sp.]
MRWQGRGDVLRKNSETSILKNPDFKFFTQNWGSYYFKNPSFIIFSASDLLTPRLAKYRSFSAST